jgi:hypothetical protein
MQSRKLPTWREMHMDTSPKVEELQFSFYRTAPAWKKLQLVAELNRTAKTLALSGLRRRHPAATLGELQQLLGQLLLGPVLGNQRVGQSEIGARNDPMANLSPVDVTLLVTDTLDRLGIPYLIDDSLASITHGVMRATMDTDLVADLQPAQVSQFVAALQAEFYVDTLSILEAIQHRTSFNLIHQATMFKVDLFLPKQRPFDRAQFERRGIEVIATEPERLAWVASAEDTVLTKLEWFRMGGEVSERQWRDVLGVLKTQHERLDLAYLRTWASQLAVADLLEQALVEAAVESE